MSVSPIVVKFLMVALCAALSLSVALVGGFLAWVDGATPAGALLIGGAAFVSAFGVLILALNALRGR